ncbi:hypothetical protein GN956_G8638 [Arapaima gigas]
MFQQNNNNNYPCQQRVCVNRDFLLEGVQGCIPSVRNFQDLGSVCYLSPVKGFRTWVVSGKKQISGEQLKPILKLADPGPCFRMAGGIASQHASDTLGNPCPKRGRTKNIAKRYSKPSQEDKQARQFQSHGTENFQCTLVKNCAKHHEAENRMAVSLRRRRGNHSKNKMDTGSKTCKMAKRSDPKSRGCEGGKESPAKADVQRFQSKTAGIKNTCLQDSLEEGRDEPSSDCTGDVKVSMKHKNDLQAVCMTNTLKYLLAKIESKKTTESEIPQSQNQKCNGSGDGMMEKLPRRWVTTSVPERHSCMETGSIEQGCGPCSLVHQAIFSSNSAIESSWKIVGSHLATQLRNPLVEEAELMGIKETERSADFSFRKTQRGQISEVQGWLEAKWVVKEPQKQALLLISREEGGVRSAIFPSRGLDSAPAAAAHVLLNPAPMETVEMILTVPSRWHCEVGSGMPALPALEEPEQQDKCRGTVASVQDCFEVEQDDDFGVFVQAVDHSFWDGDTDLPEVPCEKHERAAAESFATKDVHATLLSDGEKSQFPKSEDTWIAFQDDQHSQFGKGQGGHLPKQQEGRWWPQSAVEETNDLPSLKTSFSVSSVILDTFPSAFPPCCNPDSIMSLSQLVQSQPETDNRSLLDDLQDVNRVIGLRYKWKESHSHKLLLNSLHLDPCSKNHVSSESSSQGASMLVEKTSLIGHGGTALSHPFTRNILV